MTGPKEYAKQLIASGGPLPPSWPVDKPETTLIKDGQCYDLSEGRLLYAQKQGEKWLWSFRFPTRIVNIAGFYRNEEPEGLEVISSYLIFNTTYADYFIEDFEQNLEASDVRTGLFTSAISSARPDFYKTDSRHGTAYFTPEFVRYYNKGYLLQVVSVLLVCLGLSSGNLNNSKDTP